MAVTSATSGASVDVDSIVKGLMSLERIPLDKLNSKETSYQAKLTALGTLKGKVAALQTAAQALNSSSSSTLAAFKATSSDTSVLSASASSTAVAGTYSLAVTSLAQSQKLVAAGQVSSTAAIGDGTSTVVTFDFGTISGGTLTNGVYTGATFNSGGTTANITINSGNNTLQGIRDAINTANIGVTATIVNDGSGTPYRLALSSNNSGVSNSIKISTDGANAAITGLLAHDPAGTQNLAETVTAKNAVFSVNGIGITKTSNTVTDAIEGVTLTLSKESATANLTVERDTTAVSTAVASFVTAYNELYTAMKNSFAYKSGSALAGDTTLRSLQSQMREIAATAASGGTMSNLFEVGVSSKADGTLQLDSGKLSTAMSTSFSDVAKLFNSTTGFATRFDTWSTSALAFDGAFANRTNSINQSIKAIATQRTAMEARLDSIEKRYRTMYSSLNVTLASMNQTSAYLTQQLK
ncbi:MAG: flagellar filament capping protein FliD [Nitrosomonadales bacterium]|nr:flagellar filament capping protein FliD [Nitrosomonadales bacterium]